MRIGLDFDNTIVCYGEVFHSIALDRGLIPEHIDRTKDAIRDYCSVNGMAAAFTELQGYVYGPGITRASLWAGLLPSIQHARQLGHEVFVVSHKTHRPLAGYPYDLRAFAMGFLEDRGLLREDLIPRSHVFFEDTIDEKIQRISRLRLDAFVDDLRQVLLHPEWPTSVRRILFDPYESSHVEGGDSLGPLTNWHALSAMLLRMST